MTRISILAVTAILLAASPAFAGDKKAKVTVTVEITIEDLTELTEVPTTVETAANAGSTETEIQKAYGSMKLALVKGKPAKAIGMHFKAQAEAGKSDEGLGDVVKDCVDKGLQDEKLIACVTGEWDKKPKKDKAHPIVKAKPLEGKVPVAVTVQPKIAAPVAPSGEGKQHEATATDAGKGKKKGALKAQ